MSFAARLTYQFRITHRVPGGGEAAISTRDTLNPGEIFYGGSVAAGLLAPPQPWLKLLPGVVAGSLRRDSLFSRILGQERTFTVYDPVERPEATPAMLLIFDGERYAQELPTPTVLDNLVGKGMIRSTAAVFVDTRRWDRQVDLACSRQFAEFVVKELLPGVRRRLRVSALSARTIIAGSSMGGLQAACTAFWYPTVFANILSLSGSFDWYPGWPAHETGLSDQTGWLTSLIAHAPKEPLRWFLATGTWEGDGVWENRRMRDVLIAKGYPLVYQEYDGGHDEANWRGIIADGLLALLPAPTGAAVSRSAARQRDGPHRSAAPAARR